MISRTSAASVSSRASERSSQSPEDAKTKHIRSSGRGGAGNIKQAAVTNPVPVHALALGPTSAIVGREIAGSSNAKMKINSGRGGSGNIHMRAKVSSNTAAIISQHEAPARYFEQELIMASVTKRQEAAGASGRGGVGNNYLKVMGKIMSSSATTLSPDKGYMASSSVIPIEPPARPARPRAKSLGRVMLCKFRLRKKGKAPELPIALNDMAHVPYSPSGSEDIALPPAPPPTATSVTRSLSDSDISSSMHTGSAAYTAGGGSSRCADDWSSFAESTWSFHVTRARPPQANSLAPLRVSSSFAATATAHTAGAPNERTYERPLSIRSVGTFGVPKRKAAVADEGGDSPTFRASTSEDDDDEDDEDIGRHAYLPSLAVDEEDEDVSDDDHTHAFVYPPATCRPGWYYSQLSQTLDERSNSSSAPAPALPRSLDGLSSARPSRISVLAEDDRIDASISTTSTHALARAARTVPRTRPVLSPLIVSGTPPTHAVFPSSLASTRNLPSSSHLPVNFQ